MRVSGVRRFEVPLGDELLVANGGRAIPEAKELKQLVGDRIAPDKPLGLASQA